MAIAQDFLEAAYTRSSANDAGKLASDLELLGHLARVFARAFSLFARAKPEEAQSQTSVALGGTTPTAALPVDTIDIRRVENVSGAKVHIIPATEKDRSWHLAPSVMRVGGSLVSRGKVGDPASGDVLTLYVLDQPPAIASLSTVIDPRFPRRHHQLLIDELALYLDTKDVGRDAQAHEKLVGEAAIARQAFAAEFGLAPGAVEWGHDAVERKPIAGGGAS